MPPDTPAFFRRDGDWFVGNDAARGPWSADACHAGPVTGLVARALEAVGGDKQLARLSVGFHRPIPLDGLQIDAAVEREGRAATTATATLRGRDGRIYAVATSLHLATYAPAELPTVSLPHPAFVDAKAGRFPVQRAVHGLPFFGSSIEVAFPPGETGAPGPTTMWMRTPAIVQCEHPSPFQTMCPIADCGNGISRNAEFVDATFINADLTITAHRLPESEWLASQARSFWEPTGIGMSHAILFDTRGPIGVALQTLIVRPNS